MNCEVGMYMDFKVTETGIPYGCDGLSTFNNETWAKQKAAGYHSHEKKILLLILIFRWILFFLLE